jgi:hypothetical protein
LILVSILKFARKSEIPKQISSLFNFAKISALVDNYHEHDELADGFFRKFNRIGGKGTRKRFVHCSLSFSKRCNIQVYPIAHFVLHKLFLLVSSYSHDL